MFVAEKFIRSLIRKYGKRHISTDRGTWYYHPQACRFLNVEHHPFHSSYQKSIIERTILYVKDRTECFDDYFPCRKYNDCNLKQVMNWLGLFVDMYNKEVMEKIVKESIFDIVSKFLREDLLEKLHRFPLVVTSNCLIALIP